MTSVPPLNPKIYHIVHIDRLNSIIRDAYLWSDAIIQERGSSGTTIGMSTIKERRLNISLDSYLDLHVGDCVPSYFCPRSVMLYLIYCSNNPELTYKGGQEPIIHLVSDLNRTVAWASTNQIKWAFTLSNAGAYYFEDREDLALLKEINWPAVQADRWSGVGIPSAVKEGKQAEFLIEKQFPWELVESIGVYSETQLKQVKQILQSVPYQPSILVKKEWYY